MAKASSSPTLVSEGYVKLLAVLWVLLVLVVLAGVFIATLGTTSTTWRALNRQYVAQMKVARDRTLARGVVAYEQSRYGGTREWTTQIIAGKNFALFRLPVTSRLRTQDFLPRGVTSGRPQTVLIGCTFYRQQPNGTYWKATGVETSAVALNLLEGLDEGRLTDPIHLRRSGSEVIYSVSVTYRHTKSWPKSNPRTASSRIVIQGGLVRSIQWNFSAGTGPDAQRPSWSQVVLGDFGHAAVTAPRASEISKAEPSVGRTPAACREK